MIKGDFYGNSFVWWTGIVEDRDDPLKLGRIRVRIFGLHSEDTARIPKENLPWAQIMMPTTGTQSFFGPRPGDWVMGFFQDGPNAQLPVIMGTYSGIDSTQSITYTLNEPQKPVPPGDTVVRRSGEPFVPRTARGQVWGTPVNRTNQQRAHVCDVSARVRALNSKVRAALGTIVQKIRDAIRVLLAALGLLPDGGLIRNLIQLLKQITAFIRKIRKFLQELIDIKNAFLGLVKKIRNMIAYILALPARLLKFLRECLSNFLASLASELSSLFSPAGLGNQSNPFSELASEFRTLRNEISGAVNEIVDLASTPGQVLDILTNPPTEADLEDGRKSTAQLLGADPESSQTYERLTSTVGTVTLNQNGTVTVVNGEAVRSLNTEFDNFENSQQDPVQLADLETSVNQSITTTVQNRNIQTTTSGPSSLPSSTFISDMVNVQSSPLGQSPNPDQPANFSKFAELKDGLSNMAASIVNPVEVTSKYGAENYVNNPPCP